MREGNNFIEEVMKYIKPGMRMLDLGCGSGGPAEKFMLKGCDVTGVDKKVRGEHPKGMKFVLSDIVEYLEKLSETEKFDIIFAKNSFQFISREDVINKVFPNLKKHLNPDGYIAIQTFGKDPVPPLDNPMHSLWQHNEITKELPGMNIIHAETYETLAHSGKGEDHVFVLTDVIAKL